MKRPDLPGRARAQSTSPDRARPTEQRAPVQRAANLTRASQVARATDPARAARAEIRLARRQRRAAIRADQRRFTAERRRRRRVVLSAGAAIGLLFAGVFGVAYSPLMAVRSIQVIGVSRMDPTVIQAALAGQLGTPLPLVSADAITKSLAAFPTVQSFSTESVPPSTLIVRIVERTPIGTIKRAGNWDVVDAAGVVMATTATAAEGVPQLDVPAIDAPAFGAVAAMLLTLPAELRAQAGTAGATTAVDAWFQLSGGPKVVWGDANDGALKLRVLQALLASSAGAREINVAAPNSPFTR